MVARDDYSPTEANVSTGWHAIEFLCWGQDLNADGPGSRPIEDQATNANADRRSVHLSVVTELLIDDLPKSDAGRRAVLTTIESLEDQTDSIVAAAEAIGVTISVS